MGFSAEGEWGIKAGRRESGGGGGDQLVGWRVRGPRRQESSWQAQCGVGTRQMKAMSACKSAGRQRGESRE